MGSVVEAESLIFSRGSKQFTFAVAHLESLSNSFYFILNKRMKKHGTSSKVARLYEMSGKRKISVKDLFNTSIIKV